MLEKLHGHMDIVEEDNKTREKNEIVEAERKGDTKPVQGEGTGDQYLMESEGGYEVVASELLGATSERGEEKTERHGGGTRKYNRR